MVRMGAVCGGGGTRTSAVVVGVRTFVVLAGEDEELGAGTGEEPRSKSQEADDSTPPPETDVEFLPPDLLDRVTSTLKRLVADSGGPAASMAIRSTPTATVDVAALFNAWARHHGERQADGSFRFGPSPGLWHALQALAPIEEPKRWNHLRKVTLEYLEAHGWHRESPPRGSVFIIRAA